MLKKISYFSKNKERAFLAFCNTDEIYGPRMYTIYKAHGITPDTEFWLEESLNGEVKGVLTRFYGTVYLASSDTEGDFFLPFLKKNPYWAGIEGKAELVESLTNKLSLTSFETSFAMIHDEETFLHTDGYDIRKSENLRPFFSLLCACHEGFEEHTNYNIWYEDYATRIMSGRTELWYLYENGAPVACATMNVTSDRHGVLGSVSTLPDYRGKGYGRVISSFVTRRITDLGLTATLQCHEDSLLRFYQPLGYRPLCHWGMAERVFRRK